MIPAGTVLTIRMVDSVDSQRDYVGQTYQASLDEPVFDPGGRTLVPRGADVVVKLVDDVQSGKIEGRTVLTLDIVSLRVNGREVDVDTTAITQQSDSRGARSGKVIGGTAALGAIIGGYRGRWQGSPSAPARERGAGTVAQVAPRVSGCAALGDAVDVHAAATGSSLRRGVFRFRHRLNVPGYSSRWLCRTALAAESAWCAYIEMCSKNSCGPTCTSVGLQTPGGCLSSVHLRPLALPVFPPLAVHSLRIGSRTASKEA